MDIVEHILDSLECIMLATEDAPEDSPNYENYLQADRRYRLMGGYDGSRNNI